MQIEKRREKGFIPRRFLAIQRPGRQIKRPGITAGTMETYSPAISILPYGVEVQRLSSLTPAEQIEALKGLLSHD